MSWEDMRLDEIGWVHMGWVQTGWGLMGWGGMEVGWDAGGRWGDMLVG